MYSSVLNGGEYRKRVPDPRERKRGKKDGLYIAGIAGLASLQVGLSRLSGWSRLERRMVRACVRAGQAGEKC
jgi:hypothetical protein